MQILTGSRGLCADMLGAGKSQCPIPVRVRASTSQSQALPHGTLGSAAVRDKTIYADLQREP